MPTWVSDVDLLIINPTRDSHLILRLRIGIQGTVCRQNGTTGSFLRHTARAVKENQASGKMSPLVESRRTAIQSIGPPQQDAKSLGSRAPIFSVIRGSCAHAHVLLCLALETAGATSQVRRGQMRNCFWPGLPGPSANHHCHLKHKLRARHFKPLGRGIRGYRVEMPRVCPGAPTGYLCQDCTVQLQYTAYYVGRRP